jgi:ketol-acid reductoisomerase
MPSPVYFDSDAEPALLASKCIAVLGYGSQGAAQALNLRDSGFKVVIGLYPASQSAARAHVDGFDVLHVAQAVQGADVVSFQVPDEKQPEVFKQDVSPHLRPGMALVFSHGYNLCYADWALPKDVDVLLVAPLGPGPLVRSAFESGSGVPCLVAVAQAAIEPKSAFALALAYARGIGGTKLGASATTVREETETDLFGEQVVLCGGVAELVRTAFETLLEAGYQEEIAYTACLHELKQTVDLMQAHGIAGMNRLISNTAEYGEYVVGPRIITEEGKRAMRDVLSDIRSGNFAKAWAKENRDGQPLLRGRREALASHPLERVGAQLRARLMGKEGSAL